MIEVFKRAEMLPIEWDRAAESNYALYKDSLMLLEDVNPCRQAYAVFKNGETFGILIHYELKINMFCYSRFKLDIPVTVIGVPCSVCECGYSFQPDNREEVGNYIKDLKGAKLILNASDDLEFLGFAKGYTLPSCVMEINWGSFDEYLNSLRSHYRYRYKKALRKSEGLTIEILKDDFTPLHYNLYEQVFNKSEYKLEKLSIDYFTKSKHTITEFKLKDKPVAFIQHTIIDKKMVFLFGGLDYELNTKYDLYINMLLYLVRAAVENSCTQLNLGQTAEEVKCRLGAFQEEKYLYIHHSNPIINSLASVFKNLFSYKMKDMELKVLKR